MFQYLCGACMEKQVSILSPIKPVGIDLGEDTVPNDRRQSTQNRRVLPCLCSSVLNRSPACAVNKSTTELTVTFNL